MSHMGHNTGHNIFTYRVNLVFTYGSNVHFNLNTLNSSTVKDSYVLKVGSMIYSRDVLKKWWRDKYEEGMAEIDWIDTVFNLKTEWIRLLFPLFNKVHGDIATTTDKNGNIVEP